MSGEVLADFLLAATRLVGYAGALTVIGTSAFRLAVSRSAGREAPRFDRTAATIGLAGSAALIAGALGRLYAQTYSYFGLDEPITLALLFEVATDLPPWSTGWSQQFLASCASTIALALARTGSAPGWGVAHLMALAVAATMPLTGHAVAQQAWYGVPITLQAGHVLGAGIWIGGLFVLFVAGVRPVLRSGSAGRDTIAALVNAFSPMALAGAGLLAVTGSFTALLYFDALESLWSTSYGRVFLFKLGLSAGVAAAGAVNWRRVRPGLHKAGGADVLRRTAAVELSAAIAVLGATAVLVGLPQP